MKRKVEKLGDVVLKAESAVQKSNDGPSRKCRFRREDYVSLDDCVFTFSFLYLGASIELLAFFFKSFLQK